MVNRPDPDSLIQQLYTLPYFTGLSQRVMTDLVRGAVWRLYAPGEVVFMEGATSPGLHYLATGWLKVVRTSLEGREQVLRFLGPGEIFNEIGAFANRPNPATAIALEPADVWLLQRDGIMNLLREQPDLARLLIERMVDYVIELVDLVSDLSLRSVTSRLARLLLNEASGDVVSRPRWRTQAELAARLGTVPDVVQRALRGLESEGAIEIHRHEIRICNRAALEATGS